MSTGNLRTFIVPHVTGQTFRRVAYISSSASALEATGVEAEIVFSKDGTSLLRLSTDAPVPSGEGSITITEEPADDTHDFQYLKFELEADADDADALTDESRGFFYITWANGDFIPYFKLQINLETL